LARQAGSFVGSCSKGVFGLSFLIDDRHGKKIFSKKKFCFWANLKKKNKKSPKIFRAKN